MKEGCLNVEDEHEDDDDFDVAGSIFEPVDEYISLAHEGDIEEEAID